VTDLEPDAPAPAAPSHTVLVVDDEPMVRKSLARAIERNGTEVVTAADGEEALAKFQELRNPVVFADFRMPKMDGMALLRSVKRMAPDTSVVLITGYASEEITAQAMRLGARYVLSKPFTHSEVQRILSEVLGKSGAGWERTPVLTENARMQDVLALARRVAKTDATVLIQGETGTGKELLARFIHRESARAAGPFIAVNCSALPETLIESELFGHERGAFTGAVGRRTGWFEAASGGTLVLDEITEIPLGLQAKLLRALQEREVVRVGSNQPVAVDVRVIAVTNRDLKTEVLQQRFRADLFYRLNVVSLRPPALRERASDIPVLARHFLLKYGPLHGSRAEGFSPDAMKKMLAHAWPGNVRELENVVQRAVILAPEVAVRAEDIILEELPAEPGKGPVSGTVADVERDLILSTLERLNGNRTHTAKALGITVRTVRNRLRKYRMQQGLGGGAPHAESA
jgi:DNA-binding NtrC family response regulator